MGFYKQISKRDMKKSYLLIISLFIAAFISSDARATFSIVAIDPVTGEVGSAGASCIGGSIILSDMLPGLGGIHTQSFYLSANQNYARQLMLMGLSPQQIIDSLVANDAQGNPTRRQYGIVDFDGGGRAAAFTGANCFDWKGHITGPTYSIQGNILLGPQILDSMEARFLNTQGTLAEKLMAALQGAKVPAADTRCNPYGISSLSSFVRVARPGDTLGTYYLDLNVNNVGTTPPFVDPIDSLQVLFDAWLLTGVGNYSGEIPAKYLLSQNFPNPFNPETTIRFDIPADAGYSNSVTKLTVLDVSGREAVVLINRKLTPGAYEIKWNASGLPSGVYFYTLTTGNFRETKRMILLK